MYLKRVELYGFKSFADRTAFDLSSGITAVLGPNGCGKSNVVDAIKWVLGESSPKNLRGSQMQDVIFAGAQGRKPLGMAEVTLIFDNADRALPLDFPEIAVTRRLFRAGDSEYEINKHLCRRRDIRDLFLDTGVGMSAYSFIEQGRVEALLQAKPEERRQVIEEAAAISKYKQRRNESSARLDRTSQSLLRVNDVLDELDKNIKRVGRQASNAKRHQQLSRDLRAGRTLHYSRLAADYLSRLDDLDREKTTAENTFAERNARQNEIARTITALSADEIELLEKVEHDERAYRQIQAQLNQIQIELATCAEKRETFTAARQNAAARAATLREKLTVLSASLLSSREEFSRAELQLAESQKILDSQDGERGEIQRQFDNCENRISQIRDGLLAEIMERRGEIRANESQYAVRAAEAENRLQEHLSAETALSERENSVALVCGELQEKYDAAKQSFDALTAQIAELKEREKQLRERRERAGAAVADKQQRLSSLRGRFQTLQELADNHEGAFAGVKAALHAKERGDCRDLLGMVADVLKVPEKYAVAIETALGGSAQDLITRTASGAQQCIQYLKINRAGRATFLPLDRISPRPPLRADLLKQAGVVGEAFELVDFTDEFQRAVEYLLNGVLIVEDLTVARQLAGGAAKGVRIVTLDGEVISPHGAMTGGQGAQQRGGLITRNAERDALSGEIAEIENQIKAADGDYAVAGNELATVENQRQMAELNFNLAMQNGAALEREIAVKNGERERAVADRSAFAEVRRRLESDRDECAKGSADFGAEKAELDNRETALKSELDELLSTQKNSRDRLSALGDQLAGIREKRGAASAAVGEWSRRLRENENQISEINAELAECETGGQRAAEDDAANREMLEKLRAQEEEWLGQRAAIGDGDTAGKERLRELREQLDKLRAEEKDERQAANAAYEIINVAKVKIGETQVRWETLVEKARVELQIENLEAMARERLVEPEISAATGEAIIVPVEPILIEETDINTLGGDELATMLQAIEDKITRLGPVNLCAIEELAELEARAEFLRVEHDDIQQAADDLRAMIEKLNGECDRKFSETFEAVNRNFQEMFAYLFGGGQAELILAEAEEGQDQLDRGIDIIARPPGKSPKSISLLSGGEKALSAVALLFAIFRCKPSPFCVLDEVDGPLDESNIDRFMEAVRKFTQDTQFIIISHSKRTMSMVDTIYGVTQEQPGISTRYSLHFSRAAGNDDPTAKNRDEQNRESAAS